MLNPFMKVIGVRTNNNINEFHVEFICPVCGKSTFRWVEDMKYAKLGLKHIQDIFPELPPEERELFLTSICLECQDKIFSDPDDEGGNPEDQ